MSDRWGAEDVKRIALALRDELDVLCLDHECSKCGRYADDLAAELLSRLPDPASSLRAELEESERAARALLTALERLDLSDDYTLNHAAPGELINCHRPVEAWREVRDVVAALADQLSTPGSEDER